MNGWTMYALFLLAGGTLLYLGAEWLVSGGAGLARRLGVPQLMVGLTVVAYGTSAPELIVGIQAGLTGHGDLALGNVVGSNIANLGLILGGTALLHPARVNQSLARGAVPVLLGSTALMALFLADGVLARWESGVLVALSILYTLWMVRRSRRENGVAERLAVAEEAAVTAGASPGGSLGRLLVLVLVGLGMLVLGGHLLVEGASRLAMALGMSERLVGLTIVAVGTSVPELATSVVAALRGHTDMAVGNVVGSNIFNALFCLGTAGLTGSIAAQPLLATADFPVLFLITALSIVMLRTARTVNRWEGGVLLACYAGYLGWLAMAA